MLHFYSSPYQLKECWEELYSSSSIYTPFQSYNANECYFRVYAFKGSRRQYKPLFVYHTDGKEHCIVPLLVHKREKILRNFSSFGPIDYYDFIASNNTEQYIRLVLREIMEYYKDYNIIFENIPENSILYALCSSLKQKKEICVHIHLEKFHSADEYIQSLSKHQRQNIRTTYNRTLRNYKEIHMEAYGDDNPMPRKIHHLCTKMYDNRYAYKFLGAKNKLFIFIRTIIRKLQDPLNRIIKLAENNITYVLFYDDVPVAYLSGFYSKDKSIFYVPRLTCAIDFLTYDPGIILILETIKVLKNGKVAYLDLTRGDEPYKYAMGGEEHFNYTIIDSTNNIKNVL